MRETIRRRLEHLPHIYQNFLTTAAVIGREFSLDLLAESVEESSQQAQQDQKNSRQMIYHGLETARTVRLIEELPDSLGAYRFVHALVRETLIADLATPDRVDCHQRIGRGIERLYASSLDAYNTELAYHFYEAARAGSHEKQAWTYTIRAGDQASAQLAFEEAAGYYERALQLAERVRPSREEHCTLLLSLGTVQMRAGNRRPARTSFQQAADMAKRSGLADVFARAALGFAGKGDIPARLDERMVDLLDTALTLLPQTASALRVRVLSRLAVALYFSEYQERRMELSQQAVDQARQLGDNTILAAALNARHMALLGPDTVDERLALADELIRLSEQEGRKELLLAGRLWRILDQLELGNATHMSQELQAYADLAHTLRQPFFIWQAALLRAMWALLQGNLDEAERLSQAALPLGQEAQTPNAALMFAIQFYSLRREQGKLEDLEDITKNVIAEYPSIPSLRPGLAFLYSELDRRQEAWIEFEQLAASDFSDIVRDQQWFTGMVLLAQVAAYLGDTQRAALLYEKLHPHAEQNIVLGVGVDCYGSVARYLGILATTLSRWDEAAAHFEIAIKKNAMLCARPFIAHTQYEYAVMLAQRGQTSDLSQAQTLLAQAHKSAQELGLSRLLSKATIVSVELEQARQEQPAPSAEKTGRVLPDEPAGTAANAFLREGSYWTLSYHSKTIRLRHAKGLHYISTLLREPSREFHVSDLVTLVEKPDRQSATSAGIKDELAQQNLTSSRPHDPPVRPDAQAKANYRQRMTDIQGELDEAEQHNDLARIAHLQAEWDTLSTELAGAYGMGSHAHANKSQTVEKTRKAVASRIRDTLNKIKAEHPHLWRHLFSSIKTGVFCSYQPEQPIDWRF